MSVLPLFRGLFVGLGLGFSWLAGLAFAGGEISRFIVAAVFGVLCLVVAAFLWHHGRPPSQHF